MRGRTEDRDQRSREQAPVVPLVAQCLVGVGARRPGRGAEVRAGGCGGVLAHPPRARIRRDGYLRVCVLVCASLKASLRRAPAGALPATSMSRSVGECAVSSGGGLAMGMCRGRRTRSCARMTAVEHNLPA